MKVKVSHTARNDFCHPRPKFYFLTFVTADSGACEATSFHSPARQSNSSSMHLPLSHGPARTRVELPRASPGISRPSLKRTLEDLWTLNSRPNFGGSLDPQLAPAALGSRQASGAAGTWAVGCRTRFLLRSS